MDFELSRVVYKHFTFNMTLATFFVYSLSFTFCTTPQTTLWRLTRKFSKISITEIFFILYVSGKFPWRFWRDLINSNASYGNFKFLFFVLTSNIFFMYKHTRNGCTNLFESFRDFYEAWRKFLAIFKRICPTTFLKINTYNVRYLRTTDIIRFLLKKRCQLLHISITWASSDFAIEFWFQIDYIWQKCYCLYNLRVRKLAIFLALYNRSNDITHSVIPTGQNWRRLGCD